MKKRKFKSKHKAIVFHGALPVRPGDGVDDVIIGALTAAPNDRWKCAE